MLTVNDVIQEVQSHYARTGQVPVKVMVLDEDYYKLKNERIVFKGSRITLINCGRVVNEECAKKRTFKRS